MNNILDTILKDTFTLSKLKTRLRILKAHLLKAFFGGTDGQTFDQQDLNWLSLLPEPFLKNFNKENIYKIFNELESMQSSLPILTIFLPIEATDAISLQIGSYARKTFQSATMLLDTKYDQALIAGAAFVWKGVYRDYSLRAKIEERKEGLLQNFKKFLK